MKKLLLTGALTLFAATAHADKNAKSNLDVYKVDPTHTFVMFKAGHLGFSHVYGRFTDVKGTFAIDEKKPENSSIDLAIATNSVTTQDEKRDKHLMSPDFFNAKKFPKITFKSTQVKKKKGNTYKITGDLTMNGTTKKVTFDMTRNRTGQDPWKNTRTGADAQMTLKRSDFGIKHMMGAQAIPDMVTLLFSVEGIKQ